MSFERPVFIRVIRTRLYPLFPCTACYSPSSLQRFYFLLCNCPLLASADLRSPRSVSYSTDRREICKSTLSRTTDHLANTIIKTPWRLTTQKVLRKGLYLGGEKTSALYKPPNRLPIYEIASLKSEPCPDRFTYSDKVRILALYSLHSCPEVIPHCRKNRARCDASLVGCGIT